MRSCKAAARSSCSTPETEAAARPHFYAKLGLTTPDADTLRSIPAERLLVAQAELGLDEQAAVELGGGRSLFMPVIDGDCIDAEPLEAVRAGRGRDVDLLAGTIRDEFALLSFMIGLRELNEEAASAALAPQCEASMARLRSSAAIARSAPSAPNQPTPWPSTTP